MPLPPVATIAACGSILTACKSAWELSRMIKKKEQEKRLDSSARIVIYDLRRMYLDGLMDQHTFEKWYDRLLGAVAEKDGPELQKIRAHLGLIQRDKAHILRRATHADGDSERKYAHRHHHRSRSMDGRRSTRNPPAVYTVEEYEEAKSHRPSHIDTAKAQRDHYYAHALPSPYKGEIEYTPTTDEDESSSSRKSERQSRGHGRNRHGGGSSRTTSYRSESKSTTAGDRERGRTRSRSVHTDRRVSETDEDDDSDADSGSEGYYDQQRRRRKRMSSAAYDGGGGGGRGRR